MAQVQKQRLAATQLSSESLQMWLQLGAFLTRKHSLMILVCQLYAKVRDMFQHSELQSLFNTFVSPLRIPQKSWISARSSWIKNAYGDSHVEHAGIEMATLGNQKKWSIASEVEICVKTRCVLPDPVVLKRGAGRW